LKDRLAFVKIRFACAICDYPGRLEIPGAAEWQCPSCDHVSHVSRESDGTSENQNCAICGNAELYKKKDFPHWLGMSILVGACLASVVTYWLRHQWWTWVILIGSAAFDGVLFLLVGDVTVCYRCGAHHRELPAGADHAPFELSIAERYRQERIRREQLQANKKATG